MTDGPRCNWLIDHNPDDPPHNCGRPVVALYERLGVQGGKVAVKQTYYRCIRHDTDHAKAIIRNSPEWVRKDV